ncbi:MAG: ATP-binding protein [Candidatus Competibacteraceae bacterium]
MPKMRTSFQGLVRLLAQSLYPEPDVFIRELLQNAHDSIQLRRVYESGLAGEIRVDVDEPSRTLTFSDNGTGMDRRDIEDFLSVIGSTGTGSRARELASRDVAVATIGQFGIGLLSAFVVAERIDVYTRKPGATQTWRWINQGGEDYELDALPAHAQPPGTRVVVTLAAHQTAFLDSRRMIVRACATYSRFPAGFPILLNGFGPINAVDAPWHESGWRDVTERERMLTTFLSQRYADPPLLAIPVDLPSLRALVGLFVPARYTSPAVRPAGRWMCFRRGCAFGSTMRNCCRSGRVRARRSGLPGVATDRRSAMCWWTPRITRCAKRWAVDCDCVA